MIICDVDVVGAATNIDDAVDGSVFANGNVIVSGAGDDFTGMPFHTDRVVTISGVDHTTVGKLSRRGTDTRCDIQARSGVEQREQHRAGHVCAVDHTLHRLQLTHEGIAKFVCQLFSQRLCRQVQVRVDNRVADFDDFDTIGDDNGDFLIDLNLNTIEVEDDSRFGFSFECFDQVVSVASSHLATHSIFN